MHTYVQSAFRVEGTHEEMFQQRDIIFGDFMKRALPIDERSYEEIIDPDLMAKVVIDYVKEYNMDAASKMDLVMFKEALLHISRVARVLR